MPNYDIDPYEVLKVSKDSKIEEIKRSYRKLCLKYHPDKVRNDSAQVKQESIEQFEKIQFAHSILIDEKKRKRFDQTGSLEEVGDDDFNWFDYFNSNKVEITEQVIEKDKQIYQNSKEEDEDIIESWVESNGDFLFLFESIPHVEVNKSDEERLFNKINQLIDDKVIEPSEDWDSYQKNRTKLFNKYKRSIRSEEKEAAKLKDELSKKHELNLDNEDDLKQLIRKKQKNSMNDLIERLEDKYNSKGKAKGNGKAKAKGKNKNKNNELNDEEFERFQKKLFKK